MMELNVYTDASSYNNGYKDKSKEQISYSVGVLSFENTIIKSFEKLNFGCTNNYGELNAILISLKGTLKYVKKLDINERIFINVYSDSQLCVFGLTKWMRNWKKNIYKGKWHSSTGPVANQELYEEIDDILQSFKEMKCKVKICHIRGHINPHSKKDIAKAIKTFEKSNGFVPSNTLLDRIVRYNNICDLYAVKLLKEWRRENGY